MTLRNSFALLQKAAKRRQYGSTRRRAVERRREGVVISKGEIKQPLPSTFAYYR